MMMKDSERPTLVLYKLSIVTFYYLSPFTSNCTFFHFSWNHVISNCKQRAADVKGQDWFWKTVPGFIFVVHRNFKPIDHRLLAITEKCIFYARFPMWKFNMAGMVVLRFLGKWGWRWELSLLSVCTAEWIRQHAVWFFASRMRWPRVRYSEKARSTKPSIHSGSTSW